MLFNVVALPLAGVLGSRLLPSDVSGMPPAPYTDTITAFGEGIYAAEDPAISYTGNWQSQTITAAELGTEADTQYNFAAEIGAVAVFFFNGQKLEITHSTGPDHGIWTVEIDGAPLLDSDGEPVIINAFNPTARYDVVTEIITTEPGEHAIRLIHSSGEDEEKRSGLAQMEVLPPLRVSSLGLIVGLIFAVQAIGLLFAFLLGKPLFGKLAETIDTRRGILIALLIYTIIAIWGYFIDSVIEFWFLAWMVAVVQGGSQALSRSLFSTMVPAAKSGEFFGLFGIMEKFSAMAGPLVFAWAAATFGSSRPAVLSIVIFFIVGGFLLTRVNIEEGKRVAQEENAALLNV